MERNTKWTRRNIGIEEAPIWAYETRDELGGLIRITRNNLHPATPWKVHHFERHQTRFESTLREAKMIAEAQWL